MIQAHARPHFHEAYLEYCKIRWYENFFKGDAKDGRAVDKAKFENPFKRNKKKK